jgi:prevent-host-death family protein
MLVVNIHEAKTHLSRLLERARLGEEVIIAKAGRPIARLTPIEKPVAPRKPGSAKGRFVMAPDFDDPLPESLLAEFER